MYKNYIFDLYGTLVDIHTNENTVYFWDKCAALLQEYGCPYEAKELKKKYTQYVSEEKKRLSSQYRYPEIDLSIVFKRLFADKQFAASKEFLSFYASAFRVISRKYLCLYPDVPAIFSVLKKAGKKIYLLSNAQSLFTIPELKELSLYEQFDDILISSDCHCKKPDSQFMNALLQKNNLTIAESIMIGNEYESDIAVADAVGMDSYYIHSNLSPAFTGKEDATYMDLEHGAINLSDFEKIIR